MDPDSRFSGALRANPANPRYFTDDTGRAIYLTGSHTWAVLQDMWLEGTPRRNMDYAGFLQMLEDHGHNFLRFWSWMHPRNAGWSETPTLFDPQPFARTGPGTANDGLPKFDLSRWNDAYFERLRDRVEQAGRRGIYVSVMLFEAWTIKVSRPTTDPWPYHPMHPANNVNDLTDDPVGDDGRAEGVFSLRCPQLLRWQKEYVKKVVETVGDLDPVLTRSATRSLTTARRWSGRTTCAGSSRSSSGTGPSAIRWESRPKGATRITPSCSSPAPTGSPRATGGSSSTATTLPPPTAAK
jgi:hypothetical protein